MSTITRELAKLFRKITNSEIDAEGNAHVVLSPADSLLINNARIALASLEAEPVGEVSEKRYGLIMDGCDSCGQDCGADMAEDPDGEFVMFDDVVNMVQFDTTAKQFESLAKSE